MRPLALIGKAGHQHDDDMGIFGRHIERQRNAVHDGHLDIAKQQVEPTLLCIGGFGGQPAILLGHHLVALHGEGADHEGAHGGIVFGNKNAGHQGCSGVAWSGAAASP